ncbi:MAG: hypothetical protein CEE38_03295 [Planctomycetes bacterium B3_Pla]|nr:MAG: hypothetical protein CEE38_03295 [Planctomycetes bacterium B3_Pla]
MKTLAILTNGGDSCALNASIRSMRDSAYEAGYKKIYGIRRGYQGLLDGWIDDITGREIDVRIGGSCLGSMRTSPTRVSRGGSSAEKQYEIDEDVCLTMACCLSDFKIDVLVVVGGDGTLQSTKMFQTWVQENKNSKQFRPFEIMGFLKTIDNDIRTFTSFEGVEMALCPGYPSAVRKIIDSVEALRVTARTAERAFAIEIMGRDAGWLAAAATFGGAEILLVPEHPKYYEDHVIENIDSEDKKKVASETLMQDLASEIAYFYGKNRNVLIAVGEGFEPRVGIMAQQEFVRVLKDLYGPRKKAGATELLTMLVAPYLDCYFRCQSRFASGEHRQNCIRQRLSATIEQEELKVDTKDQKRHPLQGWDIKQELLKIIKRDNPNVDLTELERDVAKGPETSAKAGGTAKKKEGSRESTVTMSSFGGPPYKFEIRPHRTDYLPRSGQPSSYDFRFATVLGKKLGQMLLDREFGFVPALDKVVPYEDLTLDRIKVVSIDEIKTLGFSSPDYFKKSAHFQVSERITQFLRTITSGPDSLEEAIHQYTRDGFS